MVDLDEKDLLQANATIIAGVLILLTLLSSVTDVLKPTVKFVMVFAITPFLASAFALFVKKPGQLEVSAKRRFGWSTYLFGAGLVYLTIAVMVLILTS